MGVGEGGREAMPPPPLFDTDVGGPYHCENGAPLSLQQKGKIFSYMNQSLLTER